MIQPVGKPPEVGIVFARMYMVFEADTTGSVGARLILTRRETTQIL